MKRPARIASFLALAGLATFGAYRFFDRHESNAEITHRFRESVTKISATNGDILEVATLEIDETVSRIDTKSLLGNLIDLGSTVSEIKVPVVYRYHVRLSDEWDLRREGPRLRVRSPVIRPSLPPAIRTEGMEKRSEAGWLRFNARQNLEALELSLTPLLKNRAAMPTKIDLIRDAARKSVGRFVLDWMITDNAESGPPLVVEIRFADENDGDLP